MKRGILMKKKTIKAVQDLYTVSGKGFICYDTQENIIIAGNSYSAVMFTNISEEERNILESMPNFNDNPVSIIGFLQNFNNHPECYEGKKCFPFTIRDAQQEVKRMKSGRRGKSYNFDRTNVIYNDFLVEDFGVVYNLELLADVAACLEESGKYKSCNASFPNKKKSAIIVSGKYGYGIVLPCLPKVNSKIKKSDWRKSI